MNWGHRLKGLITRNWREKIISLVLAFLFWFMIKAQDARYAQAYIMPTPVVTQSPSAPSQLKPTLPANSLPLAPELAPALQPPSPAPLLPPPGSGETQVEAQPKTKGL